MGIIEINITQNIKRERERERERGTYITDEWECQWVDEDS